MNPYSKAMKEITGKRKKTDSDLEELARLEFFKALYLNESKQVIIPSEMIEACLINGAKKSKMGHWAKAGLFIESDSILEFNDSESDPQKLWKKGLFLQLPVRIGQQRIIRTRPKFENWKIEVEIKYHEELLSLKDVYQFCIDAGMQCGLGDWRPKYGRFEVLKI
jgi:hypothetical protein